MHIRILSPSGVIDSSYIDGATSRLRAWGYIVSEGAHARDEWGRFAGTDENRLADIVEAMNDASVDMILCSRGGYGLQRIIDRVPEITKPLIGFSDITVLHQKADGSWEAIKPDSIEDGKLIATFPSLSPVAFAVKGTSDKTGTTAPVLPIVGALCIVGLAFCATKRFA
jgi:hypothetical protein